MATQVQIGVALLTYRQYQSQTRVNRESGNLANRTLFTGTNRVRLTADDCILSVVDIIDVRFVF